MAEEPLAEYTDADAPQEDSGERTPPFNVLAEQSVISGMLLSKAAVEDVLDIMQPGDFYLPKHEIIADAIVALYGRGDPVDVITVTNELTATGMLTRAGGAHHLHELVSVAPTAANAGYYAEIVSQFAHRRRLIEVSTRGVQRGYATEGTIEELVAETAAELDGVVVQKHRTVRKIGATLLDTFANLSNPPTYTPTPWESIDKLIGGFAPGSLYVVAARPGDGKSNLGLMCAVKLARVGAVALMSLEMSEEELQVRLLSQFGLVSMTSLRRHSLVEDEWTRAARARADLQEAPMFIDESETQTVASIAAYARAVARKGPLAGIVVDYLQLVDGPGANRTLVTDGVAKGLKQLAKRLRVPIIVLAQLNRGERVRGRKQPLPGLKDIREGDGGAANGDVVLLLHRDDEKPHDVKVIAAKNRHGTTGVVTLRWEGEFSRMVDRHWSPTALFEDVE